MNLLDRLLWDPALVITAQESRGKRPRKRCVDRAPSTTRGGARGVVEVDQGVRGVVVHPSGLDHVEHLGLSPALLSLTLSFVNDIRCILWPMPHAVFIRLDGQPTLTSPQDLTIEKQCHHGVLREALAGLPDVSDAPH